MVHLRGNRRNPSGREAPPPCTAPSHDITQHVDVEWILFQKSPLGLGWTGEGKGEGSHLSLLSDDMQYRGGGAL